MKTYPRNQEQALLLILTITYWIVFLAICWFSFDSVLRFFIYILSQTDITLPRP
ncbi:hypothetical protein LZD49_20365 [Dyadobacter sp. CY261]|uniref:hypothetical protein n=1 Tax=Dyadobacter sp. CY261 TaxID=2907203 RepID=UPI001F43F1DA|nr:hypothetical protein [Dyadobacter sp. CY261]MCF0072846.1 hypothetical protein [Dyadobacter sp. CY261]